MAGSIDPVTGQSRRALVIGIGNDYRGDDGAGLQIARRIREAKLDGVAVREKAGDMGALIESWAGLGMVILIDAVQSGARPGTVFRFDACAQPIPSAFASRVSSHGVGVAEAIELAQTLDQMPERLIVYGVEGLVFNNGIGLSPAVERAISEVADRILEDLHRFGQFTSAKSCTGGA
jgi:hydrogenase maturation protease